MVGLASLAIVLCALPWVLGDWPLGSVLLASAGLYHLWCYWPRWRLGIPATLLKDLGEAPFHLSFDDGPTAGLTERVLDTLKAHGKRASFFVLVPKARANPALIQRMLKEGHVLGLHGADHRTAPRRSRAELAAALSKAKAELEQIAGTRIELYRPSHGFKNVALVGAVRDAGLKMCFWDTGVWDTDAPPPELLSARLQLAARQGPCPVLLMHDGRGDDPAVPVHAESLVAALGDFLNAVRTP